MWWSHTNGKILFPHNLTGSFHARFFDILQNKLEAGEEGGEGRVRCIDFSLFLLDFRTVLTVWYFLFFC
jgi:hypothetical protein